MKKEMEALLPVPPPTLSGSARTVTPPDSSAICFCLFSAFIVPSILDRSNIVNKNIAHT